MAKVVYQIPTPDGKVLTKVAYNYVDYTVAVIAYMRLKKPLNAIAQDDPDNPKAEFSPVHRAWCLWSICETQKIADTLAAKVRASHDSVEQIEFVPIQSTPYIPTPGSQVEEEGEEEAIESPTLFLTLDQTYVLAAEKLGIPEADLRDKYKHLNAGIQRMNLNNRLRNLAKKEAK